MFQRAPALAGTGVESQNESWRPAFLPPAAHAACVQPLLASLCCMHTRGAPMHAVTVARPPVSQAQEQVQSSAPPSPLVWLRAGPSLLISVSLIMSSLFPPQFPHCSNSMRRFSVFPHWSSRL